MVVVGKYDQTNYKRRKWPLQVEGYQKRQKGQTLHPERRKERGRILQ